MEISGAVLAYFGRFWSFWTSNIDSGGPHGSRCRKRELGSLAETHFSVMFARSAKDSRISRYQLQEIDSSGSIFLINKFHIQVMGCSKNGDVGARGGSAVTVEISREQSSGR